MTHTQEYHRLSGQRYSFVFLDDVPVYKIEDRGSWPPLVTDESTYRTQISEWGYLDTVALMQIVAEQEQM